MANRLDAGASITSIVTKGRATPMAQQSETPRTADPGGILTGYRWVATVFAALIILQAFLGMSGFVNGEEGQVTTHEMIANAMFLLIIVQTVLAWLLYTRNWVSMNVVVMNVVLILLTIGQIGLGYAATNGDNFPNLISLHVPNGVLLMGVSTVVAVMAWLAGGRRTAA
jgi:hypothetical protein